MHSFTSPPGSEVLREDKTILFLCQYIKVTYNPLLRLLRVCSDFYSGAVLEQRKMCCCGQDIGELRLIQPTM